jgi:putative GTP pyrophosphokinase
MSGGDESNEKSQLETHAQAAVSKYLRLQTYYEDLASVVGRITQESLKRRNIKVHSIQNRAKDPVSFERKAAIPSDVDPNTPKYNDPLQEITDLAGVRVITFFPGTLGDVDRALAEEFEVVEKSNKGLILIDEDRFGYQSIHYLVRIKSERTRLAEYGRFSGSIVEIQVRTILQHAWAEIEHDIQYKSSKAIPKEIRRRFMALAGMLEIADREFQAIQDADKQLEDRAISLVQHDQLRGVEITPNAVKYFLDRKLGPDGRISAWSYDWTARLLRNLGFDDLDQVSKAIAPYNDDRLSVIAEGTRQGQTSRFELMLLAALGERFIQRHPWGHTPWFFERRRAFLQKFLEAGILIDTYNFDDKGPELSDVS